MARWEGPLEQIDEYRWLLPVEYKQGMRVPGMLYADEAMLVHVRQEQAPEQVANVAFLPGIVNYSMAMPDVHWGYGFPIGGVAAMREEDGVVSPGGVGFDINCGVRIMRTNLIEQEVKPKIKELLDSLFVNKMSLGSIIIRCSQPQRRTIRERDYRLNTSLSKSFLSHQNSPTPISNCSRHNFTTRSRTFINQNY